MGRSGYLSIAPATQNQPRNQPPSVSLATPFSAVSSFNLPPFCDSSLVTPVSMPRSPPTATNSVPFLEVEENKDIKLSPSEMSSTFQWMDCDADFKENSPMKHKNPSGAVYTSSVDSAFPFSPVVCPEPFWGAYGVSATPVSIRSESSSNGLPSPAELLSPRGVSGGHLSYPQQQPSPQSSSGYRSPNMPILMRTSPLYPLQPPTTLPCQTIPIAPRSTTLSQSPFIESPEFQPPRSKRRKSPAPDSSSLIVLEAATKPDDILLLDLTHYRKTPWKDVIATFKKRFNQDCTDSCLQMRKKRLVDRLRIWLDEDRRALGRAVELVGTADWLQISDAMMSYGCKARYSKELCQKEWQRLHPEDSWYSHSDMEIKSEGSWTPDEDDGFSDSYDSRIHSVLGDSESMMSVGSAVSLEHYRSRTTSDASTPNHRQPHLSMYGHH